MKKLLFFSTFITFLLLAPVKAKATETNTTPTRINADKLEYNYEERVVYLRGSVVVRDPKGILKSDNATVYFEKAKDDGKNKSDSADIGNFSRVVAVGHVKMSSDDKAIVVVSDKAVWNKKDNTIVLTGGPPMVRQGTAYIRAKRIVYDLATQRCDFKPDPEVVFHVSDSEKTRFLE